MKQRELPNEVLHPWCNFIPSHIPGTVIWLAESVGNPTVSLWTQRGGDTPPQSPYPGAWDVSLFSARKRPSTKPPVIFRLGGR